MEKSVIRIASSSLYITSFFTSPTVLLPRKLNKTQVIVRDTPDVTERKKHHKSKGHHKSSHCKAGTLSESFHFKKETEFIDDAPIADFSTTEEMEDLMIPPFFQHNLINGVPPPCITKLRDWQKELLSRKEWQEKQSCVCVAPTSGGKTLIAECAIAQTLDDNPYAKIIYALPFVALASEKFLDIEKRFNKYSVRPYFQNVGGSDFRNGSIAICTYEKAHSLMNQAITNKFVQDIKLVIVDECHMIGDESRGIVAEGLIMKLRSLDKPPQIIALTATLNKEDANKMAKFVGGYAHICNSRSSPLKMFIAQQCKNINQKEGTCENSVAVYNITNDSCSKISSLQLKNDCDISVPLTMPLLQSQREQSVLIFVNTRSEAKKVALAIAKETDTSTLKHISHEKIQSVLNELKKCPGGADPDLIFCVERGITFHHAGLMLEERRAIEKGSKEGAIHCIVATTTLCAGVNITSVSRVIILNPYRYHTETQKKELIAPSLFAQMSGRAGRTETAAGEVVVIARNSKEMSEIIELMRAPLPGIEPNSTKDSVFSYMLQSLSLGITQSPCQMDNFIKNGFDDSSQSLPPSSPSHSLQFTQSSMPISSQVNGSQLSQKGMQIAAVGNFSGNEFVEKGITKLRDLGLVEKEEFAATKLGVAVTAANLTADEGVSLNEAMKKVMKNACLTDEIHLLSLCIPANARVKIPPLKEPIWEKIFSEHEVAVGLITGYNKRNLQKLIIDSYRGYTLKTDDQTNFEIIFSSCILFRLINEYKIQAISDEFDIDRGMIQALQNSAAARAGQAARFAESMGFSVINAELVKLRRRLNFGVKEDILELLSLPNCKKDIARMLYDSGHQTPSAVAEMSLSSMYAIVRKCFPNDDEKTLRTNTKKIIDQAKKYIEHLAILQEFEDDVLAKMSCAL